MADEPGVSPSCLNHLERKQWPLTARMPPSAGETLVDRIETPAGERYVSVARALPRTSGEGLMTIELGCEERHAPAMVHADALGAAARPIGPACHLYERPDCPERALPPVTRSLDLNQYQRPIAPDPFRQM